MLSHHHKTVFVHIPKNAGQSIETVFLDLLGLSWNTRAPLLMRTNDVPGLGPYRLAHLTADQYVSCKHMTQEQFDYYFTFSFVRNPWDRAVSLWKYTGFAKRVGFKPFVMEHFDSALARKRSFFATTQTEYLYDSDGTCLVDFVGRFEALQADFNEVVRRLELPPTQLPHVNHSKSVTSTGNRRRWFKARAPVDLARSTSRPYRDLYDDESRECVGERYKDDVANFGYSF